MPHTNKPKNEIKYQILFMKFILGLRVTENWIQSSKTKTLNKFKQIKGYNPIKNEAHY